MLSKCPQCGSKLLDIEYVGRMAFIRCYKCGNSELMDWKDYIEGKWRRRPYREKDADDKI